MRTQSADHVGATVIDDDRRTLRRDRSDLSPQPPYLHTPPLLLGTEDDPKIQARGDTDHRRRGRGRADPESVELRTRFVMRKSRMVYLSSIGRPTMNHLRRFWLLVAWMLLAACGDSGTNPAPTLDGAWRGQVVPSDAPIFDMELTLAEDSSGDLTGTGAIIVTEGNITVTLGLVVESGSHNHPAFSMRLGSSELDLEDFTFSGTLTDGQLVGELNGSGFSRVPATLSRR